ncbi:hypothetical protein B0J15DRAFT_507479 [Fusarium solani]|uniref:Uncharacterized protein n=1 Tax=Fusarium solani TaxID=169388 RepID=A0A9P9L6Z4_FUSSL|nr:uncharacterized protein B0J15DRAFT_507479 [Fusarium solani]KAH7276030.1 hypothetical protein B0J15DRAFT_507479 [Fusarium solani]
MKHLHGLSLACLVGLTAFSTAADISYVTDLEIFTYLAPCVSSAISYNVAMQTYSTMCGDSETELQKCICSTRFNQVASSISSDVTYSCGSSASDDLSSASKLMDKYCHQDKDITFFSPTTNVVEAYITDLPELAYLPPCAQSGISYAVVGVAAYRCPEAAELNAPCVCNKKDVVHDITETLKSSVKYSCSNNQDVTSAQNFYSEFCAMNDGTTSFATPKGPPGDMSYYITALPQYQSLSKCAQSGIESVVLGQSSWLCGEGPQELASLTSLVKGYCDSTNIGNVTSAVDVFRYYCSAAESLVVATVGESIHQSYPTASSGAGAGSGATGPVRTGSGHATLTGSDGLPEETGSSGSSGDGDSAGNGKNKDESGGTNIVPIAGGIAGVVVVAAIGIGLFMFIRRRRQREARGVEISNAGDGRGDGPPEYTGQPELMGNSEYIKGHYAPPAVSELSSTSSPKPELYGGKPVVELPPNHAPTPELQSHPAKPVYEFPANPAPTYNPQSNMGFQSGPVESYELDSNVGRWAK